MQYLRLIFELPEIARSVIALRKAMQVQNEVLEELAKDTDQESRVIAVKTSLEFHQMEQRNISYALFGRDI